MNRAEYSIREALPSDYDGLCEVFAELDARHRKSVPNVFQESSGPPRSWDYILKLLIHEDSALFVAHGDGRVLGLVVAILQEVPDVPILISRRYAQVQDLAVREGYRRLGIGSALMERVHHWARDRGVTEVELGVWEFNADAIAFYERLGYRTFSRRMWHHLT